MRRLWSALALALVAVVLPLAASAAPTYVQFWSSMTAAGTSEASRTLTFNAGGSGAANPANGNLLLCSVHANGNTNGIYPAAPSGWALLGHVQTNGWSTISVFSKTAVGGGTDSCAAANFGGTGAAVSILVTGEEISGGATVDIITTAAQVDTTSPFNTATGSGVAAATGELQFLFGALDDAILAPSVPAGFTQLAPAANGNHGDGTNAFGGSYAVARANALTGSTTIASQTITWAADPGTWGVVGMSVVVRSPGVVSVTGCNPPQWMGAFAFPTDAPEPPWIGAIVRARGML